MKKKTKSTITYSIIILSALGIIGLVMANKNNNNSSDYSAGVLAVLENNFDFQTISMKDGNVSHSYEITNKGQESVIIKKIYTSCMCTIASVIDKAGKTRGRFGMPGHGLPSKTNIEVKPRESVFVEAVFDPTAHGPSGVGLAQRSIYLETNSQKSPKVELRFTAMVTK